jgi:single-strand DNA-binding protein
MATLNGVFRIGRDAQLRYIPSGTAVLELALAYNYGKKGDDGKKPTTWVQAALWNKQAEALAPYIKKGDKISAIVGDLHVEPYSTENSTGCKLVGRIIDIELISSRNAQSTSAGHAEQTKAPQVDYDDDLPF